MSMRSNIHNERTVNPIQYAGVQLVKRECFSVRLNRKIIIITIILILILLEENNFSYYFWLTFQNLINVLTLQSSKPFYSKY